MRGSVAGANLVCCLVCKVYVGAGRASEARKRFTRLRTSIDVVGRQGPNTGTSMTLKSIAMGQSILRSPPSLLAPPGALAGLDF